MDLIAGTYSDSSADSENDSELEDVDKNEEKAKESTDLIPLPNFELDSSGMGKSREKIDPKVIIWAFWFKSNIAIVKET